MKQLRQHIWQQFGNMLFWLTWPGIWFIIQISPPRTRVVILHKQEILLVRDWLGTGQWKLPGGGLKKYEDPSTGAIREVAEETGIAIPASKLKLLSQFKITSHGFRLSIVSFSVQFTQRPTVKLQTTELTQYRWVELNEAPQLTLSKTTQHVIAELLQQGGSTE